MPYNRDRFGALAAETIGGILEDLADNRCENRIIRDWLPDGTPFYALVTTGGSAARLHEVIEASGMFFTPPPLRVLQGGEPEHVGRMVAVPAEGPAVLIDPATP